MTKKILLVCVVVLVAATATYYVYRSGATSTMGLPKNPAVLGTFAASTQDSITIELQDGSQKTFSVSSSTQVVSQVAGGEAGKALSQFAAGAAVQVQPSDKDKRAADMVLLVPAAVPIGDDPAGPPITLSGMLVATTTSSISIQTEQDPSLRIMLSADTLVYSNALAGRKGASLDDVGVGAYVQVMGVATTGGVVARSIQLLVPLAQ